MHTVFLTRARVLGSGDVVIAAGEGIRLALNKRMILITNLA